MKPTTFYNFSHVYRLCDSSMHRHKFLLHSWIGHMNRARIMQNFLSSRELTMWIAIRESPCERALRPATDDSQNSHKHVSWLFQQKKVLHAQELPTRITQFVLLSHANDQSYFIYFLMRKSLCVSQVTASIVKE